MKILVLPRLSYYACGRVEKIVAKCLDRALSIDMVLVCGSIQACYDMYEYLYTCSKLGVFGVDSIDSDIYETRFLKTVEGYVSGQWRAMKILDKNVCIGGIDELNRVQNMIRLLQNVPSCDLYIIVSATPIRDTKCCIQSRMLGVKMGMDIVKVFTERLIGKTVFVVCGGESICIDSSMSERVVIVSIPENLPLLMEVRLDGEISIELRSQGV